MVFGASMCDSLAEGQASEEVWLVGSLLSEDRPEAPSKSIELLFKPSERDFSQSSVRLPHFQMVLRGRTLFRSIVEMPAAPWKLIRSIPPG